MVRFGLVALFNRALSPSVHQQGQNWGSCHATDPSHDGTLSPSPDSSPRPLLRGPLSGALVRAQGHGRITSSGAAGRYERCDQRIGDQGHHRRCDRGGIERPEFEQPGLQPAGDAPIGAEP